MCFAYLHACRAQQLRHAVLSTLPVVALGFGRLVSVKATNYQEHVGEYGVHWNFFLTIAAVNLLTTLVNPGPRVLLPLGAAVLCGYQLLLTAFGWSGSTRRVSVPCGVTGRCTCSVVLSAPAYAAGAGSLGTSYRLL
jgi:hypothetical protein